VTEVDLDATIYPSGPWVHRNVSAHGSRFHTVEAGDGPALVFLHGFPTFWWTWRNQLPHFADLGYRAIAMDLRGYAGSDHPPEGYDPMTLAGDVAAVLRSSGVDQATVIGHGWGGFIAWTMAVTDPDLVAGIVPIGMAHPRALRRSGFRSVKQLRSLRYAASWQFPFWPERSLQAHGGARIAELLHQWSGTPSWPDTSTVDRYRAAFSRWPTAHTAVEYHRWAVRSLIRPDGIGFMRRMRQPIEVPVLHVHGARDPMIHESSALASAASVHGPYEFALMDAGHFPHEEIPMAFNATVSDWLSRQ
jgi:pimeloyl-ACP methyl ester carboxylesterase